MAKANTCMQMVPITMGTGSTISIMALVKSNGPTWPSSRENTVEERNTVEVNSSGLTAATSKETSSTTKWRDKASTSGKMEGSTMVSGRTTSNMEKANSLGAMVVCTWAAMFKISERVKDFSHGKHPIFNRFFTLQLLTSYAFF